jgi:chromatin segregation and condensation protein Rec8/ScpA/Scc1 (kleisin family)
MEPARRFDVMAQPVDRAELDDEISALRAVIERVQLTLLSEHERTQAQLAECRERMERMENIVAAAAAALQTLTWRAPED